METKALDRKEIIKLWTDALRGGRYTQGKGSLNHKGRFCCLGVLCDVAIENGARAEWKSEICCNIDNPEDDGICYLPKVIMEWAGLKTQNCDIPQLSSLITMNDTGSNFEVIAQMIERYQDDLFEGGGNEEN